MSDVLQQQALLKQLIAKGKEQGYLTYAEVNDHLPQDISEPDQVEDIIQMINDMGIQVFEQAPDADELILTEGDRSADEIAAAEAAAPQPADAHKTVTSPKAVAALTAFAVASTANSLPFTSSKSRTSIILLLPL